MSLKINSSSEMTSSADTASNGAYDHVLRPRPRKPVHSQLSQISSELGNGHLEVPQSGYTTGMTRCVMMAPILTSPDYSLYSR